jgi:hypothetical protein
MLPKYPAGCQATVVIDEAIGPALLMRNPIWVLEAVTPFTVVLVNMVTENWLATDEQFGELLVMHENPLKVTESACAGLVNKVASANTADTTTILRIMVCFLLSRPLGSRYSLGWVGSRPAAGDGSNCVAKSLERSVLDFTSKILILQSLT